MSFPEGAGLLLHAEEWAAIEAEVEPQAHNAEIRRLEEALSIERERVDRLLATVNTGDAGAHDVTSDAVGQ